MLHYEHGFVHAEITVNNIVAFSNWPDNTLYVQKINHVSLFRVRLTGMEV